MSDTYKLPEAAARMGISPETLRNMIKKKETPFGLAHRNKGGRWSFIIPKEAFDRFMKGELS